MCVSTDLFEELWWDKKFVKISDVELSSSFLLIVGPCGSCCLLNASLEPLYPGHLELSSLHVGFHTVAQHWKIDWALLTDQNDGSHPLVMSQRAPTSHWHISQASYCTPSQVCGLLSEIFPWSPPSRHNGGSLWWGILQCKRFNKQFFKMKNKNPTPFEKIKKPKDVSLVPPYCHKHSGSLHLILKILSIYYI